MVGYNVRLGRAHTAFVIFFPKRCFCMKIDGQVKRPDGAFNWFVIGLNFGFYTNTIKMILELATEFQRKVFLSGFAISIGVCFYGNHRSPREDVHQTFK